MTRSGRENEAEMQWRQRLRCGIGERERDVYVCAEMQEEERTGWAVEEKKWLGGEEEKEK
jgi:hypothetical protein